MKRLTPSWNRNWLFNPADDPRFAAVRGPERGFRSVVLPHANAVVPASLFSERRTQFAGWYRRRFTRPAVPAGGRAFLDFDGAMLAAEVYINGRWAGVQKGGYVGFSVDITDFLRAGVNVAAVRVDARLDPGIPPCGKVMDFLPFGGLYRDVRLRVVPAVRLEGLFVTTPEPLAKRKRVRASIAVRGPAGREVALRLELSAGDGCTVAKGAAVPCLIPESGEAEVVLALEDLAGIRLWELDSPVLYTVRVALLEGRREVDRREARIGFREAVFTKEGPFRLNGRPVKLFGLNRHQTFPYIGAAAPARLQRRDADILKDELGCNIVRTSHYPQSPHFLDRCDEIGLLVFEEAPGWGHIGDEGWKALFARDVEAMIRRDRHHPSVILWGVRVNESGDDHDFYVRTNALARRLDPSRPTGGVRWGVKSEFLEDVFTANDYSYKPPEKIINDPPVTPYLITEYGSLADSRRTAHNEVLVRAALSHVDVANAAFGNTRVAGMIGWCAFDYASQDWVTVDGVQPWGACDLFRCPKPLAAFYASQGDPARKPVLEAATRWKVGDQAGFDPNENTMKSGHDAPLLVFSNCDRVEVFIGGERKGEYRPARERFPHLPHPPFLVTGLGTLWGPSWKELRLVGYLGRKAVAEKRFPATHEAPVLAFGADDRELAADGSDMTRLVLRHEDAFGNIQPHSRAVAVLTVEGPAELVGPNPCALQGGTCCLFLKAGLKAGLVRVTARAAGLVTPEPVVVRVRRAAVL